MVIFISSVFHEHILSFTFGFFYPVMFILFSGFGCKSLVSVERSIIALKITFILFEVICLFIPSRNNAPWNIFIWTSLFTGLGIQICLFGIEWYARETSQCPRTIVSPTSRPLDHRIGRPTLTNCLNCFLAHVGRLLSSTFNHVLLDACLCNPGP